MNTFDTLVENYRKIMLEQDIPPAAPEAVPAPATSATPGGMGGDIGGAGGMGGDIGGAGGMGGDAGGSADDMDNESKRNTDPREYTRSILSLLVDKKEGVTPEMFSDFMDSVSLAITKIKDKQGIKKFYNNFYNRLSSVLELREELKSMFNQLTGTLEDLVGSEDNPDDAGGGKGMAGPSGPGVS